jgi:hypothetical protein
VVGIIFFRVRDGSGYTAVQQGVIADSPTQRVTPKLKFTSEQSFFDGFSQLSFCHAESPAAHHGASLDPMGCPCQGMTNMGPIIPPRLSYRPQVEPAKPKRRYLHEDFQSDPRSGVELRRRTAASNYAALFSSSVPRPSGIGLKILVEISPLQKSEIFSGRDDKLRVCN